MSTIFGMLEKLQRVNLETEIPVIIQRTSYEMLTLNKTQLYNFGVNADTIKLKKYVSDSYATEKSFDNPRPGFGIPDLFVTGNFYNGFYVDVTPTKLIFDSRDVKANRLEELFGNKIYGLTKSNKEIYLSDTVMPEIRNYIRGITGLKFT